VLSSECDADRGESYYTANILSIIALGLAKLSVSTFVLRLTPVKAHQYVIHGVGVVCILWAILSLFLFALQCDLSQPWVLIGAHCPGVVCRASS
jgi:hypothetical protein